MNSMKWSIVFLMVSCCGCIRPITGNIQTVTSRTLGIDLSYNPDGMPHLKFGFTTTQWHTVPTSTNELHAPAVYSSIDVGQELLSTRINEDWASGEGVKAIDNSTHASPAKLGAQRQRNK